MLTISASAPKQTSLMVLPSKQYYPFRFQATISDDSDAVTSVAATLDWNDGTPPVQFDAQAKPLVIDTTRNLFIGTYFVSLLVWNYRQPPDQAAYYATVQIQPEQQVPTQSPVLFGPILPMDDGFPNASQWNFSAGSDLQVLKSSVKMLLITTRGERIMQPTYGTYLRRIVFEPNADAVESIVRQEIEQALAQFEPRAALESLSVNRQEREVFVQATFVSKYNRSSFSLLLPFTM